MINEELNRRINSAIIEEQEAKNLCDHIINATNTPENILIEVLEIINKKI
jgi:hypothetical protein